MNNTGVCPTELYAKLKLRAQPVENVRQRTHDRHQAENPYLKYSASVNGGSQGYRVKSRVRRAAGELVSSPDKACFMQLRADALLYNHFMGKYGQDEAIIKDCSTYNQNYCQDTLDVSNYLDLTSEDNHDAFCLVHTFTYRDFSGGTLGLAWVAEPTSGNAGVCGRYGKIRDSDKGIVQRSLNTGIVTLINYNQDVPSKVSQITLAHEVGHNFGSEHDTTAQCAPYGTSQPGASNGNYIMFPNAIPGTMINNRKFSPCSTSSMARVLESVGGVRTNCFQASDQAFCGNNVVEDTEECDCGYKEDCSDLCCYGRENKATDCKRKPGTVCSPTEGQCCTQNCSYVGASPLFECAAATECTESSYCIKYPSFPINKLDYKTFCNNHGAVCDQGECEASVCKYIDWEECFKTSAEGFSDEDMCYISCRKDSNSECIGSNDEQKVRENPVFEQLLNIIQNNRSESSNAIKLPAGAYCDNFKGFCDVFSKCRKVDAEGPFKQLTDLIFDPVTFKNIRNWAEDHWWAVLLMCVGVIVFMGVFVFVFGYNTPSQDPRKKRRGQPNAAGAGRGPGGRRVDKRSGPYSVPIPMEERRSNQPRSGANRNSGAYSDRGGRPYPDHRGSGAYPDHRGSGAYPDHRGSGAYPGRDNFAYDNRHDGHDNFGYDSRAYQPPPPYQPPKGQQFDRIQGQRY
ncbi:disintegrin and metalloproteinase domain-containing protein [Elysia marginata]|uniref:ADAM10 endopeptidase n=1 Tax=Elysia marginata TaxID=1093978 RepID=A0AAV4EGI7_9GAST|nr:disintegrin and metalloproteinase domain-containing protein [Elysia marginata]